MHSWKYLILSINTLLVVNVKEIRYLDYMGVFEELFEYLGENRDVDLGERKDWGLVVRYQN